MARPLYSTSFNIQKFSGLNQVGDGYNMNMQYAKEMENVNIEGGSFRPMREGSHLDQTLPGPISTLAYLHRRYGLDPTTLLVAISEGRVYTKKLDQDDAWVQRYPHQTIITDSIVVDVEEPLAVSDNDWVTYELSIYHEYDTTVTYHLGQRVYHNNKGYRCTATNAFGAWDSTKWEELGTDPVDILLFSNATDGMFCLYGDTLDAAPVDTPKPFGVIARYNERIWGTGIDSEPDMLVYSTPYDPFDWEQNNSIPEDGAGDILQPTWDGDSFLALRQLGSSLLAIKRNSIWRISGTNPGEFSMQQMYGGGTINENTVAIYKDYAYMMGEHGLMQYKGSGAFPFQQEMVKDLMRDRLSRVYSAEPYSPAKSYLIGAMCSHDGSIYRCNTEIHATIEEVVDQETGKTTYEVLGEEWNSSHWDTVTGNPMDNVCAAMWNDIYCLAIPIDGSWDCNAILQYDTLNRTFNLRTGVSVDSFLQLNERLLYTSAAYPGVVYELDDTKGEVKYLKWQSGFQDLGLKSSMKSAFIVYMKVDSEVPVELRVSMETEKKRKEKRITTKPGKLTRIQLNTHGRIFRLGIESHTVAPFVIAGGIRVDLELDPD